MNLSNGQHLFGWERRTTINIYATILHNDELVYTAIEDADELDSVFVEATIYSVLSETVGSPIECYLKSDEATRVDNTDRLFYVWKFMPVDWSALYTRLFEGEQ